MHVWRGSAALAVIVGALVGCASSQQPTPPAASSTALAPGASAPKPSVAAQPTQRTKPPRRETGDWRSFDALMAREASSCAVVVKDGQIIHEGYYNGGDRDVPVRVFSITKSLTALLMGTPVVARHVGLDDQVTEGTDATVRSVLAMTSGWAYSQAADTFMIRSAADKTAYARSLGQSAPSDSLWRYNNASYQVLESVLRSAAPGGDVAQLVRGSLLTPLGMASTSWDVDASGHPTLYAGVRSTCRDLARVGRLVLDDGKWRGQQVVSPRLLAQVFAPHRVGDDGRVLNAAYGLGWWTNHHGTVTEVRRQAGFARDIAAYEGRLSPSSPPDAVWALGYGQQILAVFPQQRIVAVRLGQLPSSAEALTIERFSQHVLSRSTHR